MSSPHDPDEVELRVTSSSSSTSRAPLGQPFIAMGSRNHGEEEEEEEKEEHLAEPSRLSSARAQPVHVHDETHEQAEPEQRAQSPVSPRAYISVMGHEPGKRTAPMPPKEANHHTTSKIPVWLASPLALFYSHFPYRSTRIVLYIIVIIYAIAFLIWLIFTLKTKYFAQLANPDTQVTLYHADALDAMEVFTFRFDQDAYGSQLQNVQFYDTLIEFVSDLSTLPVTNASFACPPRYYFDVTYLVCEPLVNGEAVWTPAPAETAPRDGAPAEVTLPFAYKSRRDSLRFIVHMLSNVSASSYDGDPSLYVRHLKGRQLSILKDLLNRGLISESNLEARAFSLSLPNSFAMTPGRSYSFDMSALQFKDVDGVITRQWTMLPRDSRKIDSRTIDDRWNEYLTSQTLEQQAYLQSLLSQPNVRYSQLVVELSPASFDVLQVEEKNSYQAATFFSDLGGILGLFDGIFHILFPVAEVLVEPKVFVLQPAIEAVLRACKIIN